MPRLDKTGPEGKGPITDRGLGPCKGNAGKDNKEQLGQGMALRRRAGGGKGMGKRFRDGV